VSWLGEWVWHPLAHPITMAMHARARGGQMHHTHSSPKGNPGRKGVVEAMSVAYVLSNIYNVH